MSEKRQLEQNYRAARRDVMLAFNILYARKLALVEYWMADNAPGIKYTVERVGEDVQVGIKTEQSEKVDTASILLGLYAYLRLIEEGPGHGH